jgi:hypothetical protein
MDATAHPSWRHRPLEIEVNEMAMGPYDSSLQMFVQTPRPIDMARLSFMRWLAEQGKLEHRVAGPSSGPLVGQSAAPPSAIGVAA